MMRLAHDAIQRHSTAPTMLYISLDQVNLEHLLMSQLS